MEVMEQIDYEEEVEVHQEQVLHHDTMVENE